MDEDGDMPRVARRGRRARTDAAAVDGPSEGPSEPLDPNDPAALFGESARPNSRLGDGLPDGEEGTGAPPPPRRGGFDMSFNGSGDQPAASSSRPPPPSGPADPLADDGGGKKFVGVSRRKETQRIREEEEKERAIHSKYEGATVDGIMDIPELEEEGREDLSRVVAEAPKVRTNKVQDLNELDENMQYRLPTNDDRDMDLSLLTAVLCSSEQVEEPDDIWDADVLFSNVASELYQEREKAEGVVPEGETGAMDLAGQMGGPEQAVI